MKALHGNPPETMKEAWKLVFTSENPGSGYPTTLAFQYPFTPGIKAATIFYPLDGYYFQQRQFIALQIAISRMNEDAYYVSSYEDEKAFLDTSLVRGETRHYLLRSTDDYPGYKSAVPWPLEYAVYSVTGAWGAIVSHENHALIGGNREFIETIRSNYPSWVADIGALKHYWSRKSSGRWLEDVIPRIEGASKIPPKPHAVDG